MPISPLPLEGKVALITGSSRGLGKETALELASRGADLVVNYVSSSSPAAELVSTIQSMGRKAIAIQADVSNPSDIHRLFEEAHAHFGHIDIVYSNSGIEQFAPLSEVTPEAFDHVFNVNARGQFFVGKEAYTYLSEGGRLILSSSISVQSRSVKNHAVYAGSKGAVEAFVRAFAAGQ
jgi:tetrahydroxynaphthalene reductase